MALPDFLIVGAPKAGSTALHAALARHPQLFLSTPKEPKYFLTDGRPPAPQQRSAGRATPTARRSGSGGASAYEALFDARAGGTLRGESTPFYLWDTAAHARIAATVPDVRIIAVIRDPSTARTPTGRTCGPTASSPSRTSCTACDLEDERAAARLGAVLALPRPRPLRRAARSRLFRHFPPRAGARGPLPRAHRRPGPRPSTASPASSASTRESSTRSRGSNVTSWAGDGRGQLRAAHGRAGRRRGSGAHVHPRVWRAGAAPAARGPAARDRRTGPPLPVAVRRELVGRDPRRRRAARGPARTLDFRTGWATPAAARTRCAGRWRRPSATPPSRRDARRRSAKLT